jgi:hypothetical protein
MEAEDPSRGGLKGRAREGGGDPPREADEHRRILRLPRSGVRHPPRICRTRLSAWEARLARRKSRAEVCASRSPARADRLESGVSAFRRGRLASRGGSSAPKGERHQPRRRRPSSQAAPWPLDARAPRSVDPLFA